VDQPSNNKPKPGSQGGRIGFAIAIGAGIGVAVGAASHDIATWTAVDIAVGLVLGVGIDAQKRGTKKPNRAG